MESDPEFSVQRFFLVAHDIEAAALGGSLRAEGTDNHVAARPHGRGDLPHVSGALFGSGQEMKDSAVVPYVVSSGRELNLHDIADEPVYALSDSP